MVQSSEGCDSRLGFAIRRLENCLCQPSNKGYIFRIREGVKGEGRTLSFAVPKIQWVFNPHCPYGCLAMGNLYRYLFIYFSANWNLL